MGVGESAEKLVERSMRRFLALPSVGCQFASKHAFEDNPHIRWSIVTDEPGETRVANIDGFFRLCAASQATGVVVFPRFRSADHVVELIREVVAGELWTLSIRSWKDAPRDDVLVRLDWKTPAGQKTSVMGLGPLGSMPVHRRSPYFALAAWVGGHANEYRDPPPRPDNPRVSLIDMPTPPRVETAEAYRTLWDESVSLSAALRQLPTEGAARHDVTFCLPASFRRDLETLEEPAGRQRG